MWPANLIGVEYLPKLTALDQMFPHDFCIDRASSFIGYLFFLRMYPITIPLLESVVMSHSLFSPHGPFLSMSCLCSRCFSNQRLDLIASTSVTSRCFSSVIRT
jgi:hypothetical protein